MSDMQTFWGIEQKDSFAQAIMDAVAEPLVVLDSDLRVVTASQSFYRTFQVDRQNTQGRSLCTLGEGQWDIPELRLLLQNVVIEYDVMEGYEVDREFPNIGGRTIRLSARKVFYKENPHIALLLTMDDVTTWRAMEREMTELMRQKELLLEEMRHRFANSLTIIASILLLKAKTVQSDEMRSHLQDAHRRLISAAAMQDHLHATGRIGFIEMASYLSRLCETLATSMIGESRPISINVQVKESHIASGQAVSIGLIVTELVINALKHGFPVTTKNGKIVVAYEATENNWKLSISDNGIGVTNNALAEQKKSGLGTSIVKALAQQLDAIVEVSTGPSGTCVSVTHVTFAVEVGGMLHLAVHG